MNLLIIGGTVFLGRHLVSEALARGHRVTTLNRGTVTLPEQEAVEKLIADRENNLDILSGREFDAVIDTCGYKPKSVRKSANILKDSVGCYAFISTISVYGEFPAPGIKEDDPIKHTPSGSEGDYGTLKADCESALADCMPATSLIVRPGLIVGPYDPTDRFTYWPSRIAHGGTVLAPGRPERTLQFIDVRDLSDWILRLIENNERGIFVGDGPENLLTMSDFLQTCERTVGNNCDFAWKDDQHLVKFGVKPWVELPLWLPDSLAGYSGVMQMDCRKAFASGLKTRPLSETIADTLAWDQTRDPSEERKAGISRDREREILKASES